MELDLFFYDPEGGIYADPYGSVAAKDKNLLFDSSYDPKGKMKNPGFKVLQSILRRVLSISQTLYNHNHLIDTR